VIRSERSRSFWSILAGAALFTVFSIQLAALWIFRGHAIIGDTTFAILVPIDLGLLIVAVLLPSLTRFKMTGLEAELSVPKPKEALAAGIPTEIGFGSSRPMFGLEPRP
jgi:hypothetical protein